MGVVDDLMVVVDLYCCVIGVDGLCVVDSLIFFWIINGNLNVLFIMIGEKVVDYIFGWYFLVVENVELWINLNWEILQCQGFLWVCGFICCNLF